MNRVNVMLHKFFWKISIKIVALLEPFSLYLYYLNMMLLLQLEFLHILEAAGDRFHSHRVRWKELQFVIYHCGSFLETSALLSNLHTAEFPCEPKRWFPFRDFLEERDEELFISLHNQYAVHM